MNQKNKGVAKVEALLNPRNVVIVGATDKPGNWAQRVFRNLNRYGFPGAVYPFNPARDEVWGMRCFKAFADLPEPPDHLVVLAPAKFVPSLLKDGATAGARSATVMSSGFGEAEDEESQRLAGELERVVDETGIALSGPNCLGNFNAASRMFTMTDDRPHDFVRGSVAVFGQSGGIVMAIKRTLEERGVATDALVTTGNEVGLTSADYIAYFAAQPQIRAIVAYVESVRRPQDFLAACRAARAAGKPVVVMKLGASEAGRRAAAAHTGALAGSMAAFDAVAGAAGAVRARNLDDLVELVEFLAHAPLPRGAGVGSITFSGGMRGLLLDAAVSEGLPYVDLSLASRAKLEEILSVGSIIGNPLDSGFTGLTSAQAYIDCVRVLLEDPKIDLLLLQEELPRGPGSERKERNLRAVNEIAAASEKPIAFVSMISYGLTDYSRKLRAELPHLAFLQEVEKSLRVCASLVAYGERMSRPPVAPSAPNPEARATVARILSARSQKTLDEPTSKELLAAYGVPLLRERLARKEEDAVAFAREIGFPVVAKIVSADLPHKSDIGGVRIGITGETELRAAFRELMNVADGLKPRPHVEGVLIAEMRRGGLELVLGMNRDPEMGPVLVFGTGGVEVELTKDAAVAPVPLDESGARALIGKTKAAALIRGYRGRAPLDEEALVRALMSLSNFIADAGDRLAAVDVNPFLLQEKGGAALDALVVMD